MEKPENRFAPFFIRPATIVAICYIEQLRSEVEILNLHPHLVLNILMIQVFQPCSTMFFLWRIYCSFYKMGEERKLFHGEPVRQEKEAAGRGEGL